jgi:hypothetical protein
MANLAPHPSFFATYFAAAFARLVNASARRLTPVFVLSKQSAGWFIPLRPVCLGRCRVPVVHGSF